MRQQPHAINAATCSRIINDQLTVDGVVEVSKPMLDRCKGAYMVSIININNDINEPIVYVVIKIITSVKY